ncbi:hypothetical protein HMPREF1122_03000 [Clostridioides difficile 002-P50-2011]|nr:hypothetical protein HMPREF1122_03000 [Clostridioides difficile 002-P50-2011]CCL03360.1 hypothetical protein BN167_1710013 [Clostridioides difficile E13]
MKIVLSKFQKRVKVTSVIIKKICFCEKNLDLKGGINHGK